MNFCFIFYVGCNGFLFLVKIVLGGVGLVGVVIKEIDDGFIDMRIRVWELFWSKLILNDGLYF